MSYDMAAIAHFLVVSAIVYVIICRASKMDGNTLLIVRIQHGLVAAGAIGSLHPALTAEWRSVVIAAGILGFMLMSAYRWRFNAPVGTKRQV